MSISDLSKAGGNGVNAWPSWMRIALLGLLALLLLGIFFPGIDDDLRAEVVMFAALAGAALLTLRSFLNGAQVRRERRQEIATAGSYGFTPSKSWEAHQIPVLDQMSLTSPLRNAPHTERGMLVGNVVAGRKTILFSKAYLPKRDDLFLKFTGVFGFFLRPPIHFDFTYCMVDLTPEE